MSRTSENSSRTHRSLTVFEFLQRRKKLIYIIAAVKEQCLRSDIIPVKLLVGVLFLIDGPLIFGYDVNKNLT